MSGAQEQPPITVIGMGDDGLPGLPVAHAKMLFETDVIFTSRRLAEHLREEMREKARLWPSPFALLEEDIRALRAAGRRVVVLTSGDPFWHGAGALLARTFGPENLRVFPAPSSFSLAAARMGWPLQDVQTLSLHGREITRLEPFIQPGARCLALTANAKTPLEAARLLTERGFGPTRMHILAHLGAEMEQCFNFTAQEIVDKGETGFPDLHVLALEIIAGADARIWPRAPGLPDEAFVHDGQITKQTVRAITTSALCPAPGAVLWDVGAGCGSVGVEWLRMCAPGARAIAIERDGQRCAMIAENARRLGALDMTVIEGEAPAALSGLPAPDAVFIGGAVHDEEVFSVCLKALKPGGVLVANAVTTRGIGALMRRHEELGGELAQLAVSTSAPLGGARALRPALPVTQLRIRKEISS